MTDDFVCTGLIDFKDGEFHNYPFFFNTLKSNEITDRCKIEEIIQDTKLRCYDDGFGLYYFKTQEEYDLFRLLAC